MQNVPIDLRRILSDHSVRILFLILDAELARNILWQAFMLKAYYPFYQWVIVKISQNDLISVEKVYMEAYVCDKLDILRVLKNALFVNFQTKVSGNVFFSSRVSNQDGSPESTFLYDCNIQAMNTILNNSGLLLKTTSHLANTRTTLFDDASLTTFPREVSIEQIKLTYLYRVFFTQLALTPLKMSQKTFSSFLVNLRNVSELLIFHWSSYFCASTLLFLS